MDNLAIRASVNNIATRRVRSDYLTLLLFPLTLFANFLWLPGHCVMLTYDGLNSKNMLHLSLCITYSWHAWSWMWQVIGIHINKCPGVITSVMLDLHVEKYLKLPNNILDKVANILWTTKMYNYLKHSDNVRNIHGTDPCHPTFLG